MIRLTLVFSLALSFVACGDDGGSTPPVDSPTGGGAVQAVTCPATPDATVTTTDGSFVYSPMNTTISVNQVVRFMMSSTHDVKPNSTAGNTDAALDVGLGQTKCFKFTLANTYNFRCSPHGFVGSVVVQ